MGSKASTERGWTETRGIAWYAKISLVVAIAAVIAWLFRGQIDLDPVALRVWFVDLGSIGPLAYVIIYALQVIVAPVPGLPIGVAAGYVFGLLPALLFGTVGLGIGVTVAILAGRVWGLRLLGKLAGPDTVARWGQLRLINSPMTWLVIFLGPSPDLILFVAGMTRIRLPVLIAIGLIGRAPAMAAATLLGAGALDMGPWLVVGVTLIGALFCGGGLLVRRYAPAAAARL